MNNTSREALNAVDAVNPSSRRKKEKLERVRIGMRFHALHKFLLMAHSQAGVRTLGNLVAAGTEYFVAFCEVMRRIPTRRNHTNVLQHLSGYFSKQLDSSDRAELAELIESYRRGLIPLIVPVTLIRHYVRKYEVTYLEDQVYLNPHPDELMLLNEL